MSVTNQIERKLTKCDFDATLPTPLSSTSPALEFVKSVCCLLFLLHDMHDDVMNLRRDLLTLLKLSELIIHFFLSNQILLFYLDIPKWQLFYSKYNFLDDLIIGMIELMWFIFFFRCDFVLKNKYVTSIYFSFCTIKLYVRMMKKNDTFFYKKRWTIESRFRNVQ